MADPTPEERAAGISIPTDHEDRAKIADEIRAAVAAQKERDAKIADHYIGYSETNVSTTAQTIAAEIRAPAPALSAEEKK